MIDKKAAKKRRRSGIYPKLVRRRAGLSDGVGREKEEGKKKNATQGSQGTKRYFMCQLLEQVNICMRLRMRGIASLNLGE